MDKVLAWYEQQFGKGWYNRLLPFLSSVNMEEIRKTILNRRKSSVVMPKSIEMFEAFKLCKWEDVRVVILGIEPYCGTSEATGLAFKAQKMYPSHEVVHEIFMEVFQDIHIKDRNLRLGEINDLSLWAVQGILLLNTALTVEKNKQNSHIKLWEPFTATVINTLQEKTGVIYLLWGDKAKQYKKYINSELNYILEAEYPVPGRDTKGFKGCGHFSSVNDIITNQNGNEYKIDW